MIPIKPPDLALLSILNGSSYPCLELIFMVPKVFEPLKFYCIYQMYLPMESADQMYLLMGSGNKMAVVTDGTL